MCPLLKTYAKTENKVQNRKVTKKSAVPSQKDGNWYFLPIIQKIMCWEFVSTQPQHAHDTWAPLGSESPLKSIIMLQSRQGCLFRLQRRTVCIIKIIYNIIVLNPYNNLSSSIYVSVVWRVGLLDCWMLVCYNLSRMAIDCHKYSYYNLGTSNHRCRQYQCSRRNWE